MTTETQQTTTAAGWLTWALGGTLGVVADAPWWATSVIAMAGLLVPLIVKAMDILSDRKAIMNDAEELRRENAKLKDAARGAVSGGD
jgi:heme exporter protein D